MLTQKDIIISVTVPVLNEASSIQNLLESFDRQTRKDFEVIFVDNGSTDATVEMLNDYAVTANYSIKILHQPQRGVGYARKTGMDDASQRGIPYLAGTDADSTVPKDWIEKIIGTFEAGKADVVFGTTELDWQMIDDVPGVEYLKEAWLVRGVFLKHVRVSARGANFAITKQMYRKVGGIKQPLDDQGSPTVGEDMVLQKDVVAAQARISLLDSTVLTNPRRILDAIIKESPDDLYPEGMTEIRDLDELKAVIQKMGSEIVQRFADKLLRRGFRKMLAATTDPATWQKAQRFFIPEQDQFLKDATQLDPDILYDKYRELFIQNAKLLA